MPRKFGMTLLLAGAVAFGGAVSFSALAGKASAQDTVTQMSAQGFGVGGNKQQGKPGGSAPRTFGSPGAGGGAKFGTGGGQKFGTGGQKFGTGGGQKFGTGGQKFGTGGPKISTQPGKFTGQSPKFGGSKTVVVPGGGRPFGATIRGTNRFAIQGKNFSVYRNGYRRRHGSGWATFVALSALTAIAIGGATYYPYAYVEATGDYCQGFTEDGCQLRWQVVPTVEGYTESQCVAYCPWQ